MKQTEDEMSSAQWIDDCISKGYLQPRGGVIEVPVFAVIDNGEVARIETRKFYADEIASRQVNLRVVPAILSIKKEDLEAQSATAKD